MKLWAVCVWAQNSEDRTHEADWRLGRYWSASWCWGDKTEWPRTCTPIKTLIGKAFPIEGPLKLWAPCLPPVLFWGCDWLQGFSSWKECVSEPVQGNRLWVSQKFPNRGCPGFPAHSSRLRSPLENSLKIHSWKAASGILAKMKQEGKKKTLLIDL